MSKGAQLNISRTRELPTPSIYVEALLGEFSEWAFDEERAPEKKGVWRAEVFERDLPLDLEIGTGNGFHFAHYAQAHPDRNLVGLELKYKPLIQSIRRALNNPSKNARMVRYNARLANELFLENELDRVIIHFPDPWLKLSKNKHRLLQTVFLKDLSVLQKPGSELEFKTDSRDYFDWALKNFEDSSYQVDRQSFDLHNSEWAESNFRTHFEKIFMEKEVPINYALFKNQK